MVTFGDCANKILIPFGHEQMSPSRIGMASLPCSRSLF